MAQHNDLLYNAALAGFYQGTQSGRVTPATPASTTVAAANAFAVEMDAAIPNDAGISAGGGAALTPASGAIQALQIGQAGILQGLCAAAFEGRAQVDATSADYLALCAAIAVMYTAAIVGVKST